MARSHFLTGLTAQALLWSVLLLAVPGGMAWLVQDHLAEEARLEAAALGQLSHLLAAILVYNPDTREELADRPGTALFVHQLPGYLTIDGNADDWAELQDLAVHFGTVNTLEVRRPYSEDSNSFDLVAATDQFDLFLLVTVSDDRVVYRDPNNLSVHRNDHLQMAFIDGDQIYQRYTFAPAQPGPADAFEVGPVESGSRARRTNEQIEARWQPTDNGYRVEIRIPLDLLSPPRFALTVNDVDDPTQRVISSIVGTAATSYPEELGQLGMPAARTRRLLQQHLPPNHTAMVQDPAGNRLASIGEAGSESDHRETVPITLADRRLGTLTVTAASIVQVQPRDYLLAAALYLTAVTVLLMFVRLIGWRLVALRRRIQGASDNRGRVHSVPATPHAPDEIGDLNRAFDRVSERLQQYTRYLERLSGRLAHELRTPVTVIRSSLDNVPADSPDAIYVDRARQGVERLATILNQMTEASRLEEVMNVTETGYFDLEQLLRTLVLSYRQAFPDTHFELDIEASLAPIDGLPDLIAQMLDKLVNNAIEFAAPETAIRIRLTREADWAVLRVSNSGPALPEGAAGDLFDSMVSVRDTADGTHLGLGLYIAKLVAEFHGGTIAATNREDASGVIVTVRLPLFRIVSRR